MHYFRQTQGTKKPPHILTLTNLVATERMKNALSFKGDSKNHFQQLNQTPVNRKGIFHVTHFKNLKTLKPNPKPPLFFFFFPGYFTISSPESS